MATEWCCSFAARSCDKMPCWITDGILSMGMMQWSSVTRGSICGVCLVYVIVPRLFVLTASQYQGCGNPHFGSCARHPVFPTGYSSQMCREAVAVVLRSSSIESEASLKLSVVVEG